MNLPKGPSIDLHHFRTHFSNTTWCQTKQIHLCTYNVIQYADVYVVNNLLDVCFLQRVCDNSQGVINFCLFCLFTKEVRSAAIIAIRKLCHCQSGNIIALMPDVSWFTPSINDTRSTLTADYNTLSSQENENPLDPSVIYWTNECLCMDFI